MRTQRYIFISTAIGLLLTLSGCGGTDRAAAGDQQSVATSQISVQDNSFEPAAAEITAGDTVTWTWEGDSDHNVVGDDFESDVRSEGTFEQPFDAPGTYAYRCTLHGGMDGTIVVTAAGGDTVSEDA